MAQGYYDTITYNQVIFFTKSYLGISNSTEYDNLIELFIDEAISSLNNLAQNIPRSCVKEIEGNYVKLPHGFNELLGVRFCELKQTTEEVVNPNPTMFETENILFQPLVYWNYKWLRDCQISDSELSKSTNGCANGNIQGSMQIIDGNLVFNSNISNDYSHVQIIFNGMNEDEQGRMVIYKRYQRAARSYVVGMMAKRFPELWGSLASDMEVYKAQKRFIKGDDQEKHWHRNKFEVQKILHSLFVDSYHP